MPYAYYELIRLIALLGFGVLAYQAYHQKRQAEMLIYIFLALLFQPFFKIALGRALWNVVDVIVGLYLLISIFLKTKNREGKTNFNTDLNSNLKKHNDKKG